MTYLLWSHTKTIYFFWCSWLINIKSGISISFDFVVPRVKYSTFLSISQLTTAIHWPCYCTVHVLFYFVVVFLSGSESMQFFLIVYLYMYCRWRSIYQVGIPLTRFNPVTFLCLSQAMNWIYNVTCHGIIVFSLFACSKPGPGILTSLSWSFLVFNEEVRSDCSFCWYWWNCWLSQWSLFKLSFHNNIVRMTNPIKEHLLCLW